MRVFSCKEVEIAYEQKICWYCSRSIAGSLRKNRVPETWSTPSVSGQTFEALRSQGFIAAMRYLFQRLHEVGRPGLSPFAKFLALITGIGLVALVNSFLHTFTQERRPEVKVHGKRQFSAHVPKAAAMLYVLGATLLVAANEEPSGGGGGIYREGGDDDDRGEIDWGPTSIYKPFNPPDVTDGDRGGYEEPRYDPYDPDDHKPYGRN